MTCGNVREIFIFMQGAFPGGGNSVCACLHPSEDRHQIQNVSNSAAKHFHMKDPRSEQCWLHRKFYPTLGKHIAKKRPFSSDALLCPERWQYERDNSNLRAAVLGEKGMFVLQTDTYKREPRQLSSQSQPSPAARDAFPAKHSARLPSLVRCWYWSHLSYFFQQATRNLCKATGRHFCPNYTRVTILKLTL